MSVCVISLLGMTIPGKWSLYFWFAALCSLGLYKWFVFKLVFVVYLGRYLLSLWLGNTPIHELYTAACGLYAVWLICRVISLIITYMPMKWYTIYNKIKNCTIMVRLFLHNLHQLGLYSPNTIIKKHCKMATIRYWNLLLLRHCWLESYRY